MPSYYSIIRYVPDPISEECMNVGVAVFGRGNPHVRFISDWSRARRFGGESTEFLERFAKQVSGKQLGIFADSGAWDETRLRDVLGKWHNSIQFTPPRASIKEPAALLEDISGAFLRDITPTRSAQGRTRLHSEVKGLFRKMKLLAKVPEDIENHRVVTDYLIDQRTGLFAEFALKNSALHVMETVDYRGADRTAMAKFYETGAKALVLREAKDKLKRGTKGYVVYSAHSEDRSGIRQYLALLDDYADHVYNFNSSRDLAAFGSLVKKALGQGELVS